MTRAATEVWNKVLTADSLEWFLRYYIGDTELRAARELTRVDFGIIASIIDLGEIELEASALYTEGLFKDLRRFNLISGKTRMCKRARRPKAVFTVDVQACCRVLCAAYAMGRIELSDASKLGNDNERV